MKITDTNSQPAPKPNDKPAAWDLVMQDMRDRDRFGLDKYGTRLQPFNGRDALVDAYQEALDLVVYLRAAIYERDNSGVREAEGVGGVNVMLPTRDLSMPADFGQQNQLPGGVMIRCHDCIAEHCACVAR